MAVFFFGLGSYLGIRKINLTTLFKGNPLFYVILWAVSIIVAYKTKETSAYEYVAKLQVIIGCITILRLFPYLFSSKLHILDKLYKSNFFVYAAHSLVSVILGCSVYKFISLSPLMNYLINPIVVFALCNLLFMFLNLTMPKTLNLLIGKSVTTNKCKL